MKIDLTPYLQVFRSRKIAVITVLGFVSGLPLALTGGTLQAWITVAGIDIRTIGILTLVTTPYTIKFLWSPLMDRFVPPWLGRRRGWIVLTQIGLIFGISAMAFNSPENALMLLSVLAVMVAFTSASQDIVIDAYRTDVLKEKERGVGAAVFVLGYRIAMLVSGALALNLAKYIGFKYTYLFMAGLISVGILSTFLGQEPDKRIVPPRNFRESVWEPLRDYSSRNHAVSLLILIILYKLGDAFAGTLTTTFLLRGLGFSLSEVGNINKGIGFVAVIVGALFGGTLMVKLRLFRALLIFGIFQAISNLSFMVLAWVGKSYVMFIFAVAFENLSGGMGTAAFVSLLMAMCNKRFTATQYALLSSLAAVGRTFVGPSSGFLVESIGWPNFFFITFLTALPGLFLLWWLRRAISDLSKHN